MQVDLPRRKWERAYVPDDLQEQPEAHAGEAESVGDASRELVLEVALNNMGRGLSMFDADQRLIICNETYRKIYDLPSSLCRPGTPLEDIIRFYVERDLGHAASEAESEDQECWLSEHVEQLAQYGSYSHEQELRDGRILRVTYQALPDGGWVDLQEDVTKAKVEESQLRLAAAVLSGTQEGIVITDPQGCALALNPAFTAITGYTREDLIGRNMRIIQSGRQSREFYREMWRTVKSQGHWQGEIWNKRKNGEVYPALLTISAVRDEAGTIVNYVGTSTDMTRIKRSEVKLDHLAHHDGLTDLPNRLMLVSTLEAAAARAQRHNGFGAVLFLDLDRFKVVNDRYGHAAGDQVLMMVAERLKERLRNIDTVGRLGGDEFVVILENTSASAAAKVAEAVIERLSMPFLLDSGTEVTIGATVGISLFPMDSAVASELIEQADAALYRAKRAGRNTFHFYSHTPAGNEGV